jgi:hypothetical protein
MRLAKECSPSLGPPRPTKRPCFCAFFKSIYHVAKRLSLLRRLYNQLESEKERRVNKETHQQEMQE